MDSSEEVNLAFNLQFFSQQIGADLYSKQKDQIKNFY